MSVIDTFEECKKFKNWIKIAKKGENYCYYEGSHVAGAPVGRLALQAYEEGLINLVQRRKGEESFSYWAQRKGGEYF